MSELLFPSDTLEKVEHQQTTVDTRVMIDHSLFWAVHTHKPEYVYQAMKRPGLQAIKERS